MSFDPGWLDLREPADHAARDPGLLRRAQGWLGGGLAVDLGCGTGATARAFGAGAIAAGASWRLVDVDGRLLALAAQRCPGARTVAADLNDVAGLPLDGARLVTASALLDLVSPGWTARLADRLAAARLGIYAALSYDGAMEWAPALGEDAAVTAAFNVDQRRDKGFGPALGPAGAPALAEALRAHGYRVRMAPSPWRLGAGQAALQMALVAGIVAAVSAPGWGRARSAACGRGGQVSVGHWDLFATPGI